MSPSHGPALSLVDFRGRPLQCALGDESLGASIDARSPDFAPLGRSLRVLVVMRALALPSAQFLRALPRLERLHLIRCPRLRSLLPCCELSKLRELTITACPRIESLRPLETLERLEALHAGDLVARDGAIEFLADMPRLKTVHVSARWPADELRRLVARRPEWAWLLGGAAAVEPSARTRPHG